MSAAKVDGGMMYLLFLRGISWSLIFLDCCLILDELAGIEEVFVDFWEVDRPEEGTGNLEH
jgi:hypothetical protein